MDAKLEDTGAAAPAEENTLENLLERPLSRVGGPARKSEAEAVESRKELLIDGKRVVIEAGTELELRCGEAVILLRSDGLIQIRGNYIVSHASAAQRIRGGSIHLN